VRKQIVISGRAARDKAMHRTITWLLAGCAWGVCLWGSLLLQSLPARTFGEHGICGPWGCAAPVPVLLACHAFWLALLMPPAAVAAFRLPIHRVRLLGTIFVVLGASGLVAVGVWEAATWLPIVTEWERPYFVQRYLFSVVNLVDFPTLEVLLVGACLWLAESRRSAWRATPASTSFDDAFASSAELDSTEQ
jgi:hypothetical protein